MSNFIGKIFAAFFVVLVGCSQDLADYKNLDGFVKDGFIKIDNGQLYYQVLGKGDPVIVIHGGPGLDQGYLLPGVAALAQKHQVIFYDQRGSGRSVADLIDESHITADKFVEDIETIRKTLGYDKVTLVGHSWGAMLAMRYAIKYGQNLNKMVLMNTLPATTSGINDFVEEVFKRIHDSSIEIDKIQNSKEFLNNDHETIARYYSMFFKFYLHNPTDLEKLNMKLDEKGAGTGKQVGKILENYIFSNTIDLIPELRKINIPTLVIHGESDVLPLHTAQEIANAIKDSKLIVQSHCGHFPYMEKHEEWLDHMENFLSQN